MKPQDIFNQIIDTDNADLQEAEPELFMWSGATLLVDIGQIKAGTKVNCVSFLPAKGLVQITDEEGDEQATAALKLTVETITQS